MRIEFIEQPNREPADAEPTTAEPHTEPCSCLYCREERLIAQNPKTAGEWRTLLGERQIEVDARIDELETQANGLHELFKVSHRGIIEVVEDALGREMVSDAYTAVHRLANGYAELKKQLAELCAKWPEVERVIGSLEAQLAERSAQLKEVQGNWKKYEPIVGRMEKAEARAEKAELRFKVRCQQADERDSEISDQFTLVANAERDARKRAEAAEARITQWEAQAKRADVALKDLETERDAAEARAEASDKLLELHRRFHSKVGCPGGNDCYVCAGDSNEELR